MATYLYGNYPIIASNIQAILAFKPFFLENF